MTVNDAIRALDALAYLGLGDYPLQLMSVVQGLTYADDVAFAESQNYDGERVWVYATTQHHPEWP